MRYVPHATTADKAEQFFDMKSKSMWSYVSKRKIHFERLIHKQDHEKTGIYKFLKERNLLDSMSTAKPYNKEIV